VGASVRDSILEKRKHTIPMGSQHKAMNETEFFTWVKKTWADKAYHASYKMDGASGSFEYQDGRLVAAVTRGDGFEGEDITANAVRFQGLPPVVKLNGYPFTGFVRGEMILEQDAWGQLDPDKLTNPRNCGTGVCGRKDGEDSELIKVYVFRLFADGADISENSESSMSTTMKAMGFNVVPFKVGTADGVWAWYLETQKLRPTLPYWIDGIVVKIDAMEDQLSFGESDNRPKGQIAIKFEAEEVETKVNDVVISVGHTGAIIPTAVLEPVKLGGAMNSSASLANWDNIRKLGVCIGDRVTLIRAGDIIPRIIGVVAQGMNRREIAEPTACPECAGPITKRSNVDGGESTISYCTNAGCPAQVFGKVEKFVKSVNILGLGESLIRALIKDNKVKDASDLYDLDMDIAALMLNDKTRFGSSRAQSVLENIEKARKLTLSQFLGSLGIFGLGKRRVALIQAALPGEMDMLQDWFSGKLVDKAQKAGVPNIALRIQQDLLAQQPLISRFLAKGLVLAKAEPMVKAKEGDLVFCITGKLTKPKAYFYGLIKEAGHIATDDFHSTVTHLVTADYNGTSNKLQKARKAGIPILDEAGLIKLLEIKK
jgi:DNA ligase (NAD+)